MSRGATLKNENFLSLSSKFPPDRHVLANYVDSARGSFRVAWAEASIGHGLDAKNYVGVRPGLVASSWVVDASGN